MYTLVDIRTPPPRAAEASEDTATLAASFTCAPAKPVPVAVNEEAVTPISNVLPPVKVCVLVI